jgi:peptidyl-prolyl cis-trans isomerase B (cyclophilin B)
MRHRFLPSVLPAVLLVATAALAGCGDDSSSGSATADDSTSSAPASDTPSTSPSSSPSSSPTEDAPASDVTCDYPADSQIPAAAEVDPPPTTPTVTGQVAATMETTLGSFALSLDAAAAPCTVNSFVSLAQQGYYDDSPCHRLTTLAESGIAVLQCGDPTGTGTGGPGYTYDDELSGSESYGPGTLAMANRGPNTNGSQFFIVYDDTPLPPDYTVFGTVDQAGVDAITALAAKGTVPGEGGMTAPAEDVTISSVKVG